MCLGVLLALPLCSLIIKFQPARAAATVAFDMGVTEIRYGDSVPLQVICEPEDVNGTAQFTSGNPDILRVNYDGTVTAMGLGEADITVTYQGAADTTRLTVVPSGLIIEKTEFVLSLSTTAQIEAYIFPSSVAVTYESSDTSVVTVNATGGITAVGKGAAVISVTAAGETLTVTVMVSGALNDLNANEKGCSAVGTAGFVAALALIVCAAGFKRRG